LLSRCKECVKASNVKRYFDRYQTSGKHKEQRQQYARHYYLMSRGREQAKNQAIHRAQQERCIGHYGGRCACCSEDRTEFLGLELVDGGRMKHRAEAGPKLYRWLIRKKFPAEPRVRVLCHNCRCALRIYGYCPHQSPSACGPCESGAHAAATAIAPQVLHG
jgi:hypothetical protein